MLAVLRDRSVIDDPGDRCELATDTLGTRAHEQARIPGRVGQKLLQRLVLGPVPAQAKQRRLQALPASVLDQAAHVHKRVLAPTRMPQARRHLPHKPKQALARIARRHLHCDYCFHPL